MAMAESAGPPPAVCAASKSVRPRTKTNASVGGVSLFDQEKDPASVP